MRGQIVKGAVVLILSVGTLVGCGNATPEIVSFGPNPVVHGTPFNQQPDGQSAIWVKMKPAPPPRSVLLLGENPLPTVVDGELLTAAVAEELFDKPGTLKLVVEMDRDGKTIRSKPVNFVVK